jgi:site-specific DNA-methyltransferase (adenine-specific)
MDVSRWIETNEPFLFQRGDALRLLRALPDESVDSFVSDPPYGISLKLGTTSNLGLARSIAGDGPAEARQLWRAWVPEAYRAAKPNTAHLIFGTYKSPWMHRVLSKHFAVKGCIVWDKRQISLGYYLRPRWEMIYLCHKGKPPKPVPAPADIWTVNRQHRPLHPCQKPIDLMQKAVVYACPPGGIVVDHFAGIASTGVAALLEGRRFIGAEIDPRHHKLGTRRLRDALQPPS